MDLPQTREKETDIQPCDLIEVIEYNSKNAQTYKRDLTNPEHIKALAEIPEGSVRWINVDGGCTDAELATLGAAFKIHPLAVQNISNLNQRAKIDEYRGFLHIIAKMLYFSNDELIVEHVNFILGPNYVLTFGETEGDVFDGIRSRIAQEDAQIRSCGADYLLYTMLDALVEGYFAVLETFKEKIDALEDRLLTATEQEHLQEIRQLKKDLIKVSKSIWPLRDVASLLGRETLTLVRSSTEPYLRDVYNHIVQAIDTTETCRDLLSGLADLHISNTSYKLNEIMKVLTIISTLFIPLTFIVGVYGMNFKYMPELHFRFGYWITWIVMFVISVCMVYYFKKKKWF